MKNQDPFLKLNVIAQAIYDKKGTNILALDLRKFSSLTDFVIIAEGNVDRHVMALAATVRDAMRKLGEEPVHTQGLQTGEWVVLDYSDVMVHIFKPGMREKYHLEDLWKESEIVDLSFNLNNYGTVG